MASTQNSHAGAAALAAVEVNGMTREVFILRSAMAAGAVYGLGMVTPYVRQAFAVEKMDDLDILNFALTLEYLEADFYRRAVKQAKLTGDLAQMAEEFGQHEQEHVDFLVAGIEGAGGTPVKEPKFKFPMKDKASFLTLAQTLEDTGVAAYNGAGPALMNKELLAAAGTIVQIEARHAAVIRMENGQTPAPDAFDPTMTVAQVTKAVTPLIVA